MFDREAGCFGFWFLFVAVLNVALLAFVVWVVVVLLRHFGVV